MGTEIDGLVRAAELTESWAQAARTYVQMERRKAKPSAAMIGRLEGIAGAYERLARELRRQALDEGRTADKRPGEA